MASAPVGLLRLVRPYNCLMFFAGTFVGGIVAAGSESFRWPVNVPLILASVSATLVGASGNVLNDVYDIDIDRLNRPSRPLPSGMVGTAAARALWVFLTVMGMVLAALVSPAHLIISAVSVVLLFAYNTRLKSTPLVGNAAVSIVVAMALVYGALSLGGGMLALPAAAFAFLVTMARELLKDVEDVTGDSAHRVLSLAVVAGVEVTAWLAVVTLLVTLGLTVVPFLFLEYSGMYLLLMMIADAMMLAAVWTALGSDPQTAAGVASRWTKLAMVFGLAALALANPAAL